jgi:hypothetical protein
MLPTKHFSDAGLDWGFLVSEPSNNRIAREQGMLGASATALVAGTVLGVATLGSAGSAPGKVTGGANTGNGTLTLDPTTPVLADAAPGDYQVTFTAPTHYRVEKPNGDVIGEGDTGVAFSDDVKFTIAAGGTAFVAGDGFKITVATGSGIAVPLTLAALDGGQVATKILGMGQKASATPQRVTFSTGPGVEVNGNLLTWPVGITATQKKVAEAQLAAKGIKVRYG